MTGILKIGGAAAQGSIEFLKSFNKGDMSYYSYIGKNTSTNASGYFGLNMSPGNYRPRIYIWSKNSYYFGPACVVPETGTVSCNVDLPATNLRLRVASASGVSQLSGVSVSISGLFSGVQFDGIWNNANESQQGIFDLNLIDGNYTITAYPGSNQKLGKPQSFKVSVETGTVTSIKQQGSSSNLVASGGIYTLTLASSPIAGTVVAPDGTTPTPNSRVDLYDQNKVCLYCEMQATNSDQSGYFGFEKISDGQYQMIARQPYADPTKADSLPISVTVTGGMGSSSLVVPLRNPNVSGVVRGNNR